MRTEDDLKLTLVLCRQELGIANAHPIHLARLKLIELIIHDAIDREPRHWSELLKRYEDAADRVQRGK